MQPPPVVLTRPEDRRAALHAAAARQAAEQQRLDAQAADAAGRHEDAVALLRRAAEAGDAPAMSVLGARLLIGRAAPLEPKAGVRLLERAAELGQADAHAILAALKAGAAATADQWAIALNHLERAAELGQARARDQLRLLGGEGLGLDTSSGVWSRMRRGVDWVAWTQSPPRRTLSEAPRLRAIDGFLSPAICDWLVARARPRLSPAAVSEPASGAGEQGAGQSAVAFDLVNLDVVMALVRTRMCAATRLPPAAMDPMQVLHSTGGQPSRPRFDFLDPEVEVQAREAAASGQRIATFQVHLNDGYDGGEIAFPGLGLQWRGGKGDALYFANVDTSGLPDRRTLHAATAPTYGEKWLLTQWVRDRVILPAG